MRRPPAATAGDSAAPPAAQPAMEPSQPAYPSAATLRALLAAGPGAAAAAALADAGGAVDGAAGARRAVPVEDAAALTYDDFVRRYMVPNRPVLIRVSRPPGAQPKGAAK